VSAPTVIASRIGCVAYLNARPLIEGLGPGIRLGHPSELALGLDRGDFDVALLPVRAVLERPGAAVVDGVGIASAGPVYSVVIAHAGPVEALRTVSLDPASLTSAQLARVLCAGIPGCRPLFVPGPPPGDLGVPSEGEGRLKIGDQAIAYRAKHGDALAYLDLGDCWTRRTGLPFVYAVWCFSGGLGAAREHELAELLRTAAARGARAIPRIAAGAENPGFAERYLTEHIRHRVGPAERAGLARFAAELRGLELLAPGDAPESWRWA